jgi:hypothetical protein
MVLAPTAVHSSINASATERASSRGLLVTSDVLFARAFRRELKRGGHVVPIEIYSTLEAATSQADAGYTWVAVDLDGGVSPNDAVRVARWSWPDAKIAIARYRWSDDLAHARFDADHVIHKPVRATELNALFSPARQPLAPAG